MQNVWNFLQRESVERMKVTLQEQEWNKDLTHNHGYIPTQNNPYDCGVFMCKYADWLADNMWPKFTQDNMQYFRGRLMAEILQQDLLD